MTRHIASLLVFCATFVVAPLASAAPITVPTGLNPGDQYRLVFITSATHDATSGNIADYNAFVTAVANGVTELADLGATWKAIGSTATVDARDNTDTNPTVSTGVSIYNLGDTLIATNNADLWDGTLLAGISTQETGASASFEFAWTGTSAAGLRIVNDELGDPDTNDKVVRGNAFATGGSWTDSASTGPVTVGQAIYGMSDVLTVVPEPSTMVLACLAGVALVVASLRRRRSRRPQRHTATAAMNPAPSV